MSLGEHDEANCPVLHEKFSYSVSVFRLNHASSAFFDWYYDHFQEQYPGLAKAFDLNVEQDADNEKVLSVSQYNPSLSVAALEQLYYDFVDRQEEAKDLESYVEDEEDSGD